VAEADVDHERRAMIAQHHSATHLLSGALRKMFGGDAEQRGSFVGPGRLRFDFASRAPVNENQLAELQEIINEQIRANHLVETSTVSLSDAKRLGAVAVFGESYGETVRAVSMGPLSLELCGGTHVARTGDLGACCILSESSVSSGVRRIEAVASQAAASSIRSFQSTLGRMSKLLKVDPDSVTSRVEAIQAQMLEMQRELKERDKLITSLLSEKLSRGAVPLGPINLLASSVDIAIGREALASLAQDLTKRMGSACVVLGEPVNGNLVVAVSQDQTNRINANSLVKEIATAVGGNGGGRPGLAFLAGLNSEALVSALECARSRVQAQL
jgi:alanyl-tRNA synthetase